MIEDSGGRSSTGQQRRVATLTPEIRETRKRVRCSVIVYYTVATHLSYLIQYVLVVQLAFDPGSVCVR